METRHYPKIIQAVCGTPWAIRPDKMQAILAYLELRIAGGNLTAETIEAARKPGRPAAVRGDIAVIPIIGTISHRMDSMDAMSGGVSTEAIGIAFDDAIRNPDVGAVVLDIDSPGGSVDGVTELASKIRSARGRKPIIAVANSGMASAAFWIGAAADEIVATPSAEVGSVGVIAVTQDVSENSDNIKFTVVKSADYKDNPYEPMTEEQLTHLRSRVRGFHDMFVSDLAASFKDRGVTREEIAETFADGRVHGAQAAKRIGMVDRVATFESVIQDVQRRQTNSRNSKAIADLDIAAMEAMA